MKNNNRTNKYKIIAGVLLLGVFLCLLPVRFVQAASATITISSEEEEIRVGDTLKIEITIRADATIGDFEAFISYDDSIFEFYSAVSCITGGAGVLKVADIGASPSDQDRTYSVYFKALAQGACEVNLYDRPIVYGYTDGTEMSVTAMSKTFSVLPADNASDDSSLAALHLVDNQTKTVALTPNFSTEITEYYASVPFESVLLFVSAITSDDKAEVEVFGETELQPGNNEVLVTVTAENGVRTVYTVYVYRAETGELIQPTVIPEKPEADLEPGILAEQTENGIILTEYHTYTVCDKPEEFTVPDGYVPTTLLLNSVSVTAYGKEGAEHLLLLVLKNEAGEVSWYCYDRTEQTLQKVRNEEFVITQVIESNEAESQEALLQYQVQQTGLSFAIAFVSGLCFVLLMIILWLCIKHRKN